MNERNDMTTGRILPKVLRFALPLLLTSILQQAYSMADAVIIKRLVGLKAFAAIGATGAVLWIAESMLMGLAHGFGVVFAQVSGSDKERGGLGAVALRAGVIELGFALAACACILLFEGPILRAVRMPADIAADAAAYMRAMTPFLCMAALFNVAAGLLRASGDSASPFIAMLVSTGANIALDYVLIRFAGMGVAGAGLATGAAQAMALAFCLYKSRSLRGGRLPTGTTARLLRMGLPSLLRDGVISCGGGVVQGMINGFGVHVIAGVAASKKYFSLLQMCGSALEGTTATFAGQNTGAGNIDRMKRGLRLLIALTVGAAVLTAGLTAVFAPGMIRLLIGNDSPEALSCGIEALRWVALFLPSLYILCVLRAALQNMGCAGMSMLTGFLELGGRLAAVALLPVLIGARTAYLAEAVGWALAALYLIGAYIWKMRRLSYAI